MDYEKLLSDLDKVFKSDEKFTIAHTFKKNFGTVLTAVSAIAAIILYVSKVISFLIAREQYQFWGLDESFLLEDTKVYLKFGVFFIYMLLAMIVKAVAKKYIYLWEIYDCELYIFKEICYREKKILRKMIKNSNC